MLEFKLNAQIVRGGEVQKRQALLNLSAKLQLSKSREMNNILELLI
jgi:hypothetical protein